jgi:hypothetical protein
VLNYNDKATIVLVPGEELRSIYEGTICCLLSRILSWLYVGSFCFLYTFPFPNNANIYLLYMWMYLISFHYMYTCFLLCISIQPNMALNILPWHNFWEEK